MVGTKAGDEGRCANVQRSFVYLVRTRTVDSDENSCAMNLPLSYYLHVKQRLQMARPPTPQIF